MPFGIVRRFLSFVGTVSVRTSRLAADGRYPLPCCSLKLPVFGLSSSIKDTSDRLTKSFSIIPQKLVV